MPGSTPLTIILALIFVIALMGGLVFVLKKLGLAGPVMSPLNGKRRLSVTEILPLGPTHRAILLKRDQVEHLVILGPNGETVVESNIPPAQESPS